MTVKSCVLTSTPAIKVLETHRMQEYGICAQDQIVRARFGKASGEAGSCDMDNRDLDKHGYAWFDIDESEPEPAELRSF